MTQQLFGTHNNLETEEYEDKGTALSHVDAYSKLVYLFQLGTILRHVAEKI